MTRSATITLALATTLVGVIGITFATIALASTASIVVSATSWTVGSPATVYGGGFAPNQPYVISIDQQSGTVASSARTGVGNGQTGTDGLFQATIKFPAATYGLHHVCAQVGSDVACVDILIQPSVTVTPNSGLPGSRVTARGTGFPAGDAIAMYIDSGPPFLGTPGPLADSTGSFSLDFVWPNVTGQHQVCGDSGYPGSTQPIQVKACGTFTLLEGPAVTPPPTSTVPPTPVQHGSSPAPQPTVGAVRPVASRQTTNSALIVAAAAAVIVFLVAGAGFWFRRKRRVGTLPPVQ
jgi:hypothetical protein